MVEVSELSPSAVGISSSGALFTIKQLMVVPEIPKMGQPVTIKGKVELLGFKLLAPTWVILTVTYPEKWWETMLPVIGSPEIRDVALAAQGEFESVFPQGFERDGEYTLIARLYAGPSLPVDKLVLPPFPPVSTLRTTFLVSGDYVSPAEAAKTVSFDISQPQVSPPAIYPKTQVAIKCGITSKSLTDQEVQIQMRVREASILPGPGSVLETQVSDPFIVRPNSMASATFQVFIPTTWPAGKGFPHSPGYKDVDVDVIIGGKSVAYRNFDDSFYVAQVGEAAPGGTTGGIDFDFIQPTTSLKAVTVGQPIEIEVKVTARPTNRTVDMTINCDVVDAGFIAITGALRGRYPSPVMTVIPGETVSFKFTHVDNGKVGTHRDVLVTIYVEGQQIGEVKHWNDVFTVADLPQTVTVVPKFTVGLRADPPYGGWIELSPKKASYDKYEVVSLTAYVFGLYKFRYWSDERGYVWGDVNAWQFNLSVVENKVITAHYSLEAAPPSAPTTPAPTPAPAPAPVPTQFKLTLVAEPSIGGWVTANPSKDFYNKYEQVNLTAWNLGLYRFDHWTYTDGRTVGTSPEFTLMIIKDEIITAHYVLLGSPSAGAAPAPVKATSPEDWKPGMIPPDGWVLSPDGQYIYQAPGTYGIAIPPVAPAPAPEPVPAPTPTVQATSVADWHVGMLPPPGWQLDPEGNSISRIPEYEAAPTPETHPDGHWEEVWNEGTGQYDYIWVLNQ